MGTNQTTISTDTLSSGSRVTVVIHSNAPCPLPDTDTAEVVVKPLPQPKITVEPEMCSDGGLTPISIVNQLPTGGSL
ncbi:MAG: hypothetical protein IPO21_10105 [Bacteroidales bacterium]|nr:hypothetical protein [Bacteroidales bacterium]